ncbi:hypothetical protein SSP35_21_00490 [Streptomyces sp. NBRC 110611]|nr:hypothetical protein SSP35_21_00490 [Streptomyces sp. NBRC 110611]
MSRPYEDALPLVHRALTAGVRARVETAAAVSTDLAGMDSTTVTLIAAQHGPVTGITVHPDGITEGGDMAYARALTTSGLRRVSFPLRAEHLPFTPAADRLPATDEPAPSAVVWAMLSAQLHTAMLDGSVCHLTGDGGDNLFLAPPAHLADLARRGRLLKVAADAQAWAHLRKISPWPVLKFALRGEAARLARPWLARPPWVTTTAAAGAVNAAAGNDADAVLVADVRGAARLASADVQLADALGIELHNPYFDGALLDAVVSVPSWRRFSVRRYKPMLVDSIGDLLPEEHRQRDTKGVFAADFHHGVRANLSRVLALADARLAGMGLIDPAPLRAAVHGVALGADTIWPSLLTVMSAEMWLEAVETAPATSWGPAKEVVA